MNRIDRSFVVCLSLVFSSSSSLLWAKDAPAGRTSVVTITAKPLPSELIAAPQSAAVVEGPKLQESRGVNFTSAIESTPGVSAFTSGNYVSKPVVRGLTSQRVLIAADGLRQENQQWGDEHGTQIDTMSVDRYEVLRGPNSLIYGSDALGGVIAVTTQPLPYRNAGESTFGGRMNMDYFTNGPMGAGSSGFWGAVGNLGYRGAVSMRQSGSYTTPTGELPNTGVKEVNGNTRIGLKKDWGTIEADYAHVDQKIELAEEDPAETPYQTLLDNRAALRLNVPTPFARFEIAGGFQQNLRQEFEERDAENSVLNLLLQSTTLDVRAHHNPIGLVKGTIGLTGMHQVNSTRGEETLIPNYRSQGIGGYIFEELALGKLTLSGGVRGDRNTLRADENSSLGNANADLDWSAITGSVGASYRVSDPFVLAANIGRGFRTPTPFELFSNGEHEGTNRFERGSSTLDPETSLNMDLAARWSASRIRGEIAVFRNAIHDYIYPQATGNLSDPADPDSLEIFQYVQGKAELVGGEFSTEVDATDWLLLSAGYDLVRGRNKDLDQDLPFIPADRLKFGLRLHKAECPKTRVRNSYLGVGTKIVSKQNKVGPSQPVIGGYTLWDLSAGLDWPIGDTALTLNVGVNNLLDKRYTDNLARNKTFALEPGRNVYVKASLPFGAQN